MSDEPQELPEEQASVLHYERDWQLTHGLVGPQGTKEAEVDKRFGMTSARYYQVLNKALNNPAALSHNNGEFGLFINRMNEITRRKHAARFPRRTTP
ncbi:MAG: DUF3263 domain-containing protein [Microbacteriaceae bacterium]|nr:DUF3263 domain-containing protein [Microbacteriaceae bacterium]